MPVQDDDSFPRKVAEALRDFGAPSAIVPVQDDDSFPRKVAEVLRGFGAPSAIVPISARGPHAKARIRVVAAMLDRHVTDQREISFQRGPAQ
jgi:hypothetical protein